MPKPYQARRSAQAMAALAACTLGMPAWADALPAATPYRPTISNPAELSAAGWIEVETGLARSKGGGAAWQNNTPWLLKAAYTEDFGIMLGGDADVRQTDAESSVLRGRGDTSFAFKHRWEMDEDAAFGLEWGAKFATARTGIGSGKQDYGANAIYSRDIDKTRLDANLGATRLGLDEAGLARRQYPWALALSRQVGDDWTVALEVAGTRRRGAPASTQLLVAAGYSVSKRLVLDFGMASGISAAAPKWSAFLGATYLAAQFR